MLVQIRKLVKQGQNLNTGRTPEPSVMWNEVRLEKTNEPAEAVLLAGVVRAQCRPVHAWM